MKFILILLLSFPVLLFSKEYNIADFGAVGDNSTINTKAIQKAIDECTQTGGTVLVDGGGIYVTGTIYLKDNVNLRIEAGSTLKGSANFRITLPIPTNNDTSANGAWIVV